MKPIIFFDLDGTIIDLNSINRTQPVCFAAPDILGRLSDKYSLGIITGATRPELEAVFQKTSWRRFFEERLLITATEVPAPKISGEPFLRAKAISPQKAVMIGDSSNDEMGARKADMPCVLVRKAENPTQQKENLRLAIAAAEEILIELRPLPLS